MHAESFSVLLSSHPPSAVAICMMESLFHSEKLFQVHILCQRDGGSRKTKEGRRVEGTNRLGEKQDYLFKL